MTDLNPKITPAGPGKVRMTWTPDPEAFGYRFYVNDHPVSKSVKPGQFSTTFAFDGQPTAYGIAASYEAAAETVIFPEPPSTLPDIDTPTSSVVLTPGFFASQDGAASNYQVCWAGGDGKGGGRPGLSVSAGRHWLMFRVNISNAWPYGPQEGQWPIKWDSASMKAREQGEWGRMVNWHNNGEGVSPFALDFVNGILHLHCEQGDGNWRLHPGVLTRNTWHTIVLDYTLGRPGGFRVWFDGNDTPIVANGINTLYPGQTNVGLWQGFYSRGIKKSLPSQMSYLRVGNSFKQMLEDTSPTALGGIWGTPTPNLAWALSNQPIPGRDTTAGPATITRVGDTRSDDYLIPPTLLKAYTEGREP